MIPDYKITEPAGLEALFKSMQN